MALFKIYNNFSSKQTIGNGTSATYHQGYCYLDVTTMKLWVDTTDAAAGRLALNAANADTAGAATTAQYFNTTRKIELKGDVTGSHTANGSSGWTITTTLANSGVTAGNYGDSSNQTPGYGKTFKVPYIEVNSKGLITSISTHTVKIPASDNTNTTYTFADGVNCFYVTPSGGTQQTVQVTPSIDNNVVSNGTTTADYIAKFSADNTITNLVKIGTGTTKYLREDGKWGTPPNSNTTYTFSGGTGSFSVLPSGQQTAQTVTITTPTATSSAIGGIKISYTATANQTIQSKTTASDRFYGLEIDSNGLVTVNVPWVDHTYDASSTGGLSLTNGLFSIKASGVTNDMLAGSIANAKLANSSVTIGSASVSLGGSVTLAQIGAAPSSHTHGNITNTGTIGTAGKALAVVVGTDNKITTADLTVSAATAGSGTTTTVVSAVTQAANGKISVTTKSIPTYNNYSLPLAANGTRGGVQIGYSSSGKNYAVQLSSEKMYVNVPWTDTDTKVNYTLNQTTKAYLMASLEAPTSTKTARETVGDSGVYLTATAGELSAYRYSWHYGSTPAEKAYTVWNETDDSIDFIFT